MLGRVEGIGREEVAVLADGDGDARGVLRGDEVECGDNGLRIVVDRGGIALEEAVRY